LRDRTHAATAAHRPRDTRARLRPAAQRRRRGQVRPSLDSAPRAAAYDSDEADRQVDALLSNRCAADGDRRPALVRRYRLYLPPALLRRHAGGSGYIGGSSAKENRAPSADAAALLPPRSFGSPAGAHASHLAPHSGSASSGRSRPTSASAVMQSHGRWKTDRLNPQQYHDMISPRVGPAAEVGGVHSGVAGELRHGSLTRPWANGGDAATKGNSLKYVMTPV
jgi:hypothetical protein